MTSGSWRRPGAALLERRHVHADFPLGDHRLLVQVVIFNGIFDGDDMAIAFLVDDVEHAGQGGRLAGARRAGHEDQAAGLEQQILHLRRQADFLQRQHLGGDLAQDDADVAFLAKHAHAEPRRIAEAEAEVRPAVLFEGTDMLLGREAAHEPVCVFRRQRLGVERRQRAMEAHDGRQPHGQMQVRSPLGHGQVEQVVHLDFGRFERAHQPLSPMVTRRTSSRVVMPATTLRRPSSRRVRMPSSRALIRSSVEDTCSKIRFRTWSSIWKIS